MATIAIIALEIIHFIIGSCAETGSGSYETRRLETSIVQTAIDLVWLYHRIVGNYSLGVAGASCVPGVR
jgi:hypothetical protein